jgi:hypothetical protein
MRKSAVWILLLCGLAPALPSCGGHSNGNNPDACVPPQEGVSCIGPPPPGAQCVPLGQEYDPRQETQMCCAGLAPIDPTYEPASWCDADCTTHLTIPQCVNQDWFPVRLCAPCGNGVCDSEDGENACNCPIDCPGLLDASAD